MNRKAALLLASACLLWVAAPLPCAAVEVPPEVEPEPVEVELPKMKAVAPLDSAARLGLLVPFGPTDGPLRVYGVKAPVTVPEEDESWRDLVRGVDGPKPYRMDYFFVPELEDVPPESRDSATVHTILSVDLWTAFSERLPQIVRGLFPASSVTPSKNDAGSEGLLVGRMNARWRQQPDGRVRGLEVRLTVEVTSSGGEVLDSIEGTSYAEPENRIHWSFATKWRRVGTQALAAAFDELPGKLRASRPLASHLARMAEGRALPAGLDTLAELDDRDGLLPNGRLDAGEKARLFVAVTNRGPGPAYDVSVKAAPGEAQISVPGAGLVGDLAPGERREIALPLAAGLDLPSGLLRLRLETTEKRGYGARPVVLEVAAEALHPPRLEIVDVALDDRAGRDGGDGRQGRNVRIEGDGDGRPANGETLEAIVRIRNAGPGEAASVAVTAASAAAGVEVLEPRAVIARIAANQVAEARFLLRLPLGSPASELPLFFEAVDVRGPQVGRAERTERWQVQTRRPALQISHRLYDGNSAASAGNRDGQVSNGERIEVALRVANRGDLPARGVRIAVAADDPLLALRPAAFVVGDLPAQAEAPEQRFTLEVPRRFGQDRAGLLLRLDLAVTQQDFPEIGEPLLLAFAHQVPALALDLARPETISRGAAGELFVQVRNDGGLAAEEVAVEVSAADPAIDLLDERGVPGRKRRLALGTLPAGAASSRLRLDLLVKQSAAVGTMPVEVTVSQKDFPPVRRTLDLRVVEGEVPVLAVAPAPAPRLAAPEPRPASPATISFLHDASREPLLAETTLLRFEVQSVDEPAEVRLLQNQRLVPLDSGLRSVGTSGSVRLLQYEVPVRLDVGSNDFEVVVVTREGVRSSRPLALVRESKRGRLWVVAVGVSDYADPQVGDLAFAAADARAVHDYYRDTFRLPPEQLFLRTDEQATLREIKSMLGTQLATRANHPEDTVILFFAGHGAREQMVGSLDADGRGKYLLPHDADLGDLYSTALEMDEIADILRRLRPERIVALLDSCFSGAAGGRSPFDPRSQGRSIVTGEFLERMARAGRGRIILTASGPNEVAQEDASLGHGVFTYYLLEGLRGGADADRDGEIDADEVFRYVSGKVTGFTAERQNPGRKAPDSAGRVLVGRGTAAPRR